jgi:hypothetical protein
MAMPITNRSVVCIYVPRDFIKARDRGYRINRPGIWKQPTKVVTCHKALARGAINIWLNGLFLGGLRAFGGF